MSLSPKQEQLFKQASKHIPGGVNSRYVPLMALEAHRFSLRKPKVRICGM